MQQVQHEQAAVEPLPGFRPASALWEGDNPRYPSKESALWALRTKGSEYAQAGALALHRGRTMVNIELLTQVDTRLAIEKAKARYSVQA